MEQNELVSYTYDFISQLIENKIILKSVRRIILFGSVIRGDFTDKSDIDIFIDVKDSDNEIKNIVKKELDKFEVRAKKSWHLRGIDIPIKVVVGDLREERWLELKEDILSYGRIIYGKFEESPEKVTHKILISYDIKKLNQKTKMSFIRKLSGYSLKKGKKEYIQKGLLDSAKGEKIGTNVIMIEPEELSKIRTLLKEHKIEYKIIDVWVR